MESVRRQYTAAFKRDAVALVLEQGYTITVALSNSAKGDILFF